MVIKAVLNHDSQDLKIAMIKKSRFIIFLDMPLKSG